jgi:hypothetical protein
MIANCLGWTVSILPQIEQQGIADAMDYNASAITVPTKIQYAATRIGTYLCPSGVQIKTLGAAFGEVWPAGSTEAVYTAHYYGVLGPWGTNPSTGQAYRCVNTAEAFGGECQQGAMWQYASNLRDILDGTSNTYLIGEISWKDMSYYRAWIRGKFGDNRGTLYLLAKNLQHPINTRPPTPMTWNSVAFGSQHPGGTQFVLADGSVRFVPDTIDFAVYLATGSKDGGEPQGGRQ